MLIKYGNVFVQAAAAVVHGVSDSRRVNYDRLDKGRELSEQGKLEAVRSERYSGTGAPLVPLCVTNYDDVLFALLPLHCELPRSRSTRYVDDDHCHMKDCCHLGVRF